MELRRFTAMSTVLGIAVLFASFLPLAFADDANQTYLALYEKFNPGKAPEGSRRLTGTDLGMPSRVGIALSAVVF